MRDSYYKEGSWNLSCDWCGEKIKASDARKTWDGFYVCPEHWEPRQPLDFLKGIKDNQNVPFSRPQSPISFIPTSSPSAISGMAVAGQAISGVNIIIDNGNS